METEKPQNLVDAENELRICRLKYHVARSNRAMRDAREDVDFWSDKVAMLTLIFERGMGTVPEAGPDWLA